MPTNDSRTSKKGRTFDAGLIRSFIHEALAHDAIADTINELLFGHVVEGRYHPSVIADSLRPYIDEILNTATREDWNAVAGELIADARETLEPAHAAAVAG